LTCLEELYLDQNRLDRFPEEICKMSNLLLLTLASNAVPEISLGISQLTKLTVLKMRSNRLRHISDDIEFPKTLELACLAQNMIDKFPFDKVEQLTRLRELCLYANRLKDIKAMEKCLRTLSERGGIFRCEENRVSLQSIAGKHVCDGPFSSFKWDIVWLHDGDTEVETWIQEQSTELDSDYFLNTKVYGPKENDMQSGMKRCHVICVVCTPKMVGLLSRESKSVIRTSLEDHFKLAQNASKVVPVLKCESISPLLYNNNCSLSIHSNEDDFLIKLYRKVTDRPHRLITSPNRH
jgi:Leucine-rich repeat (LRR) protein